MAKTNITVSVDYDIVELVRSKGGKLSEICNHALNTYADISEDDKEDMMRKGRERAIQDINEAKAILNRKKIIFKEIEKEFQKKKREKEGKILKSYEINIK